MSHEGGENPGTGPREIFETLVKASSERLLSLTIQLGESSEDTIICALSLIILRRDAQALNKLQMLGENSLAKHLVQKWHSSEGKLADFGFLCGDFQASTRESLAELAQVFKVLSEQRLCDPFLRDLAYKRALSVPRQGSRDEVSYDRFREEAKDVCGPRFLEWISAPKDLQSDLYCSAQDEVNTTLKVSQNHSTSTQCLPSPLQASSSIPSYPTHLEMSIPATISFQGDRIAPENPQTNTPLEENTPGPSQPSNPQSGSTGSSQLGAEMNDTIAEITSAFTKSIQIGNQSKRRETEPKSAQTTKVFLPETSAPEDSHVEEEEEEEEDRFYAFVILHAPQDTDMAEGMKERLEAVVGSEGATLAGDFDIPGNGIFQCVENAINNSAFTLLLLTQNFNTRMLALETNTALINSINREHKYNTVIPLLPKHNPIPRDDYPMTLGALIPLEENKYFEKKIVKAITKANLKRQRREWAREQRAKAQRRENGRVLAPGNPRRDEREQGSGEERPLVQPPPNIHIEHAQYIMIGNDSQMTVGLRPEDQDESVFQ